MLPVAAISLKLSFQDILKTLSLFEKCSATKLLWLEISKSIQYQSVNKLGENMTRIYFKFLFTNTSQFTITETPEIFSLSWFLYHVTCSNRFSHFLYTRWHKHLIFYGQFCYEEFPILSCLVSTKRSYIPKVASRV